MSWENSGEDILEIFSEVQQRYYHAVKIDVVSARGLTVMGEGDRLRTDLDRIQERKQYKRRYSKRREHILAKQKERRISRGAKPARPRRQTPGLTERQCANCMASFTTRYGEDTPSRKAQKFCSNACSLPTTQARWGK